MNNNDDDDDDDEDDEDDDNDDNNLVPVQVCVMYLFGVGRQDLVHIQKCSVFHCLLSWYHHLVHHPWLPVAVSLACLAWPHTPLSLSAMSQ